MAQINPIRFSTQYADDVTGDLKYLFRDYHGLTGRWLSRDPIGEASGANPYAFLFNESVSSVDSLGLDVFRIGFYGLGSRRIFGNLVMDRIGINVGATMYSQRGSRDAVADLLPQIDTDGDRKITRSEACAHTIKVFGYSYGGIAAIGFAQHISRHGFFETGGSPKSPIGYELEAGIKIDLVFTIDPVELGNPAGGVPGNVASFVNYYQRRGGNAVFRNLNGSVYDDAFGTPASRVLKGSHISPVNSRSAVQTQVETQQATASISGALLDLLNYQGQLMLKATEVNHDVMPLFVESTVTQSLK